MISLSEFLNGLQLLAYDFGYQLSSSDISKAKKDFRIADEDGDGFVSRAELAKALGF